jgi:Flp pilus assembly protein TadD
MADPRTEYERGQAYSKAGKLSDARTYFQRVIDSPQSDWTERARIELGALLKRQGDSGSARSAFEQAIRSQHPDWAPCAALRLGELLTEQGDSAGAAAAFRLAMASGQAEWGPAAANSLGMLLQNSDVAGARAAYQNAIESGNRVHGLSAQCNLGVLLTADGDLDGARRTYEAVILSRDANSTPRASLNLGVLLQQQGDTAGAREAYQRAIDSGHPKFSPMAANNLRLLIKQESNPTVIRVQQRQTGPWSPSPGENVLLDKRIVTPNSKNQPIPVTITDHRIRLGTDVMDYSDVASVSYRSWRPMDNYGAVKVTHAQRRSFLVASATGERIAAEFGDEYPDNAAVWTGLVEMSKQAIEPRLCRAHLTDIRSGLAYRISAAKRILLELRSDGFAVANRGRIAFYAPGEQTFDWTAFSGAYYNLDTGTLTVEALNEKGKRKECARIGASSPVLPHLMAACQKEFTASPTA